MKMNNQLDPVDHSTFEQIKQVDSLGNEFWYARALAKLLGYADFRNFLKVIAKAKEACIQSGFNTDDHLVEVTEVVQAKDPERTLIAVKLHAVNEF